MKHLILCIFLILSGLAQGQVVPEKDNIKVGLVLSGGGAKGFAHVGVIKVLEEAGVRVDYIAGTSMGAVIGGLYASGYNASQLDSIIKSTDFTRIIQDDVPRNAKTFYEKKDSERYAITLPFNRFKLSIPQSFSKGQNTYNLLVQAFDHVNEIQDFSKLPIPFLCIATDAENGEQVLLENGYLPEAISASGALPSLFSPVEIGNKLLIDGGVSNNYPVQELLAKGVDVIIGVDVQDDLRTKDKLNTAPEILVQISNYKAIAAMVAKKDSTNVYLRPDVGNYSVVDFGSKEAIIEKGTKAALTQLDALQEIVSRQKTPLQTNIISSSTQIHPNPKPQDSIRIETITITGNKNYTRSYILSKLKLKPPITVSYEDFGDRINNLSATQNFKHIGHRFLNTPHGKTLSLELQESENKQFIRAGLHFDDLIGSAALVNLTRKNILFNNDIIALDFIIGDNLRYEFNYYIDQGYYWSVGARASSDEFQKGVSARLVEETSSLDFSNINSVRLDYRTFTNQVYLQTLFKKQFSLDLGLQHKFVDIETLTVEDDDLTQLGLTFDESNFYGAYGQVKYDTLDNLYYPTSGIYFDTNFDLYLYSSDFNNNFTEFSITNVNFLYAKKIFPNVTLQTGLEGGFKIGGSDVRTLDFFLGGYGNKKINNLVSFYGYDFISITGDTYLKGSFLFDYKIFKSHHATLGANFANAGDNIFGSEEVFSSPDFSGYTLGYGIESLLGPLELKYSYSPEIKRSEWYITVGFRF